MDLDDFKANNNILLCPSCKKHIPFQTLSLSKDHQINIRLLCKQCKTENIIMDNNMYFSFYSFPPQPIVYSPNKLHSREGSMSYFQKGFDCCKCSTFDHYDPKETYSSFLKSSCFKHDKTIYEYCLNCCDEICNECKKNTHKTHKCRKVIDMRNEIKAMHIQNRLNDFKAKMKSNTILKNNLITLIQNRKFSPKPIEYIEKAFKENTRINQQLYYILEKIYFSYDSSKDNFCFALIDNIKRNFQINFSEMKSNINMTKQENNIQEGKTYIKDIIQYYHSNYLIEFQDIKNPNIDTKDFRKNSFLENPNTNWNSGASFNFELTNEFCG